ncbi:hypothetical protein BD324DRAFT_609823 [Kockovaella imperatae]|uniref:Calpain catalytic domain-containing protein n=1 Tax=Kockovaella imperatae TaxID=4999 RepID=A0A1Y1UC84_9TREE|nr:hypothetical protein BD324DRAFT_609823 [Kockovaella imperatae]ORX35147.1 hypothetical protein BD324DRAFT_609823 [Kockovaella imperatae]
MTLLFLHWVLALSALDQVLGGPLLPRAGNDPIFGDSGAPAVNDLKQIEYSQGDHPLSSATVPDCGFMSVLGAITHVSPAWLKSKLTVLDGTVDAATSVRIQMYDYNSLAPQMQTVTHDEASVNNGDRTDIWWPGAFEYAGIKAGLPSANGLLGPVLPGDSMSALTGLKSDGKMKPTADQLFDYALKATSMNTPMVFQTLPDGAKVLLGGHAYGLFGGSGSGSGRKLTLFNPWGSVEDYSLSDVAGDCYLVWFLSNFDTFGGEGGGDGSGDSDRPKSTKRPDPSPTPDPVVNVVQADRWTETNRVTKTEGNMVIVQEMVTVHV